MTGAITGEAAAAVQAILAGDSPAVDFEFLLLGRGNTEPANQVNVGDVVRRVTGTLASVDEGYPKAKDDDVRNPDAGADVVTWRFQIPGGLDGFIASNVCVSDGIDADDRVGISVRPDAALESAGKRRLVVFVNATAAGEPTIHTCRTAEPMARRLLTAGGERLRRATFAEGSNWRGEVVVPRGATLFTMSTLYDGFGRPLLRRGFTGGSFELLERRPDGRFYSIEERDLSASSVSIEPKRADPRWPYSDGYTLGHSWELPEEGAATVYMARFTLETRCSRQSFDVKVKTGAEARG